MDYIQELKIKNQKVCVLLASGVFSRKCFQILCLETMRYSP